MNSSLMPVIWEVVGMYHTIKHSVTAVLVLKPPKKLVFHRGSWVSYPTVIFLLGDDALLLLCEEDTNVLY